MAKIYKPSAAAIVALSKMPFSYSTWGGEVFGHLPEGIRTRAPLYALKKAGLAKVSYRGREEIWRRTKEGDNALADEIEKSIPKSVEE